MWRKLGSIDPGLMLGCRKCAARTYYIGSNVVGPLSDLGLSLVTYLYGRNPNHSSVSRANLTAMRVVFRGGQHSLCQGLDAAGFRVETQPRST